MNIVPHFIIAVCLTGLASCAPNQAGRVPASASTIGSKCWLPEDRDNAYHTAKPIIQAGVVTPPVYKKEGVSGCGAVKFQLDAKGNAFNITILRDFPTGYGFGDSVVDAVRRSSYEPPIKTDAWFYLNVGMSAPRG